MGLSIRPKTLVITGGNRGIGKAIVDKAHKRGYQIVANGSSSYTPPRGIHYHQAQVQNLADMARLRTFVKDTFHVDPSIPGDADRKLGDILVIANAGIARRKDPDKIAEMQAVNIGGTQNLLEAFKEFFTPGTRNRFVGMSSLVAAENMPVQGDVEYAATKAAVRDIVLRQIPQEGLNPGFVSAPGAVDTDMTRYEKIFGILMLGAGKLVSDPANRESPIVQGFAHYLGGADRLGSNTSEFLKAVLGNELYDAPAFAKAKKVLEKDPAAVQGRTQMMTLSAFFLSETEEENTHDRRLLVDRAVDALEAVDVAIGPEVVAKDILDTFESGIVPADGIVRSYSRGYASRLNGQEPIRTLFGAMGG